MDIELPEDKGTYVLLAGLNQTKRIEIGRLGAFDLVPGFYAYVGSAHGAGGLRARIQHHLESAAHPHWHIDYLLLWAVPIEVWYAIADRKLEQDWAEFLNQSPIFRAPIPRFGSSDYRRSRTTHLFFAKRRPTFSWFRQQMTERFESNIRPQTASIPSQPA